MYARTVSMRLKAGTAAAFTALVESEIVPLLRPMTGFQDSLTLIGPGGREAIGISVWNRRVDADRYGGHAEREVLSRLTRLLDGSGTARTYRLSSSTFHKIGTHVPR